MKVRELMASLGLGLDAQSFLAGELAFAGLQNAFFLASRALVGFVTGLPRLVSDVGSSADRIDELSQASGVSSRTLQELAHAASFSGVTMEELSRSLGLFARKNPGKDIDKAMGDLAEKFAGMPDGAKKVKLAFDSFGRSGQRMIPVLNLGREGLEAVRREAEELGLVLGEDTIRQGAKFDDAMVRMAGLWRGFKNQVGGELLPGAVRLLSKLFVVLGKVLKHLMSFFRGVAHGARVLAHIFAHPLTMGIMAVTAALGLMAAAATLAGGMSFAAGLRAALGWALAAAPVVLIVGLLAMLFLVLEDIGVMLRGGDSLIGRLAARWADFMADWMEPQAGDPWWILAAKTLLGIFADLPQALDEALEFWREAWVDFKEWLLELVSGLWRDLREGLRSAIDWIPGVDAGGTSLGGAFATGFDAAPTRMLSSARTQTFRVNQTINPPPGTSPEEIADASARRLQEFHDARLREAAVDVEQ